jgi:hypothetical protein
MSNDIIAQPYKGSLTVDLTSIAAILVDLAPGAAQYLRKEQPGFAEAVVEIKESVPVHGPEAGIPADVYTQFVECNENIAKIDESRSVVAKMLEILDETRALFDHERQMHLSLMVDTVKSTARRRKRPAIMAPFEKTMRYFSQVADKAVRTRRLRALATAEEPPQPPAQEVPSTDSQ